MTDLESILSELKVRATDPRQEKQLAEICEQLIQTFEKHSAAGLANLVESKVQPLRDAFDSAHRSVTRKLGGGAGPGARA